MYKWIFKKWDGEAWTGLILLRIETDGGGSKRSISDNLCSDSGRPAYKEALLKTF